MDAATEVGGGKSKLVPGDLSLCLNCGEMLVFRDDMQVDKLMPQSFDILDDRTRLMLRKGRRLIIQRGAFKP